MLFARIRGGPLRVARRTPPGMREFSEGRSLFSKVGQPSWGDMLRSAESGQTSGESGQTSAESGQTFAESGQTSGESGQTSGESGQTSGESGQTSGESGQTSGESGQTFAESGQVSGESGQASGESGQTSGEGEQAPEALSRRFVEVDAARGAKRKGIWSLIILAPMDQRITASHRALGATRRRAR